MLGASVVGRRVGEGELPVKWRVQRDLVLVFPQVQGLAWTPCGVFDRSQGAALVVFDLFCEVARQAYILGRAVLRGGAATRKLWRPSKWPGVAAGWAEVTPWPHHSWGVASGGEVGAIECDIWRRREAYPRPKGNGPTRIPSWRPNVLPQVWWWFLHRQAHEVSIV